MVDQAEKTELDNQDATHGQEGNGEGQESPEFEINLGDSPSQEPPKRGNPVVQRVIGQRDKAREKNTELQSKIEELESRLQEMQQGAQMQPGNAPQYLDYDSDEAYQEAVLEWAQRKQKPKIDPQNQFQEFIALQKQEKAISDHYQRAEALAEKFPDYSAAEQAANEALGHDLSLEIARLSEKSAELMLYFGRNPHEAQRFKNLASQDGTRAAIELGKLEARLNIQPKTKNIPEPDEPLAGGNSNTTTSFHRELKAARERGDIRVAIEVRKRAKAAGINLE